MCTKVWVRNKGISIEERIKWRRLFTFEREQRKNLKVKR